MARRKTDLRPGAPRDTVFEMYVQGFSLAQIGARVGYSVDVIRKTTSDATFREEAEQFRTARRESIGRRMEAGMENVTNTLIEIVNGGRNVESDGQTVWRPIDANVAQARIKAAEALADRAGFPKVTKVKTDPTVVVNRQGPPVSDADMAVLQRLLTD